MHSVWLSVLLWPRRLTPQVCIEFPPDFATHWYWSLQLHTPQMEPILWQAFTAPDLWTPLVCILSLYCFTGSNLAPIAFFFLFMALLMLIYCICATRTNLVYVLIFASLIFVFSLLAAAYWKLGAEDEVMGNRLTVVSITFFPICYAKVNRKNP